MLRLVLLGIFSAKWACVSAQSVDYIYWSASLYQVDSDPTCSGELSAEELTWRVHRFRLLFFAFLFLFIFHVANTLRTFFHYQHTCSFLLSRVVGAGNPGAIKYSNCIIKSGSFGDKFPSSRFSVSGKTTLDSDNVARIAFSVEVIFSPSLSLSPLVNLFNPPDSIFLKPKGMGE